MKMKLMSARFTPVVCALGVALSLAGSATAQEARDEKQPPRAPEQARNATAADATPAVAPNARLAALIRPGGTIIKQVGVQSVRNPDTGIYCIRPTAGSGIVPNKAVVTVSVDYYYSKFNESTAQWASRGSPCNQSNEIAVYTFLDKNLTARYSFSNTVGFSVYVP